MSKVAFLFPGQGSQYVGMGQKLYNEKLEVRQLYEEASDTLGYDMAKLCFGGPESELMKTEKTQPAILTTSIAMLQYTKSEGMKPDYVAGLSLGEYSALVCAGVLAFKEAVQTVSLRGKWMQEAVPVGVGKMAAIVGLNIESVQTLIEELKNEGLVEIANYNTHEQLVISGESAAVKMAVKKAKAIGAQKAMVLPVSAPFHCSLLSSVGGKLKVQLESIKIDEFTVPLVNNVDASVITERAVVIDSLVRQVSHSVRWLDSIETMMELGVNRFIEVGPGESLSNLVFKIGQHDNIMIDIVPLDKIWE